MREELTYCGGDGRDLGHAVRALLEWAPWPDAAPGDGKPQARRVVTFAQEDDAIAFRHHVCVARRRVVTAGDISTDRGARGAADADESSGGELRALGLQAQYTVECTGISPGRKRVRGQPVP